jgi:rSAM/selenodomain-associated transferase 2
MTLSVIIPTLNEEGVLGETLRLVRVHHAHEIIIADGGSTDATPQIAQGADLFLQGPPGRSAQMNHGAEHATGDAFLFLHADCSLEPGALIAAERCLRQRGIVAGCFRMTVQAPGLLFRLIDAAATARVRLTGLIYGDQGLFITRQRFEQVGGFPELRLMEDVFITLKLRKLGKLAVAPRRIFVSPRRWQQQGVVRQTLCNWTLTALAAAGAHPDRLAPYYPPVR